MKKMKDGNLLWETEDILEAGLSFDICKPLSLAEYAKNFSLIPPISDGTVFWLRSFAMEDGDDGNPHRYGNSVYAVEPNGGNVVEISDLRRRLSARPMLSYWGKNTAPLPQDKVILGGETWTVLTGCIMVCDRSVGEVPFDTNKGLLCNYTKSDLYTFMLDFHNKTVTRWLTEVEQHKNKNKEPER